MPESRNASPTAADLGMVEEMLAKGMPLSALSDALDVPRGDIHAWRDGGAPLPAEAIERLRLVHGTLSAEPDGSLRFHVRFWQREVPGGVPLRDALLAERLDPAAIARAVAHLRPAVARAQAEDAERKARAPSDEARHPASSLTIHLVAGQRW